MWAVVSTHTRSFAFISAGLKTRDKLFKTLVTLRAGHDSGGTSWKGTYLSPEWLCICDWVYQLNVWSSGHHLMHLRGGHSWDIPGLICRGEEKKSSIMLGFKQKTLYFFKLWKKNYEVNLLQCRWIFLVIHFQKSVFGYGTMKSDKSQRKICHNICQVNTLGLMD